MKAILLDWDGVLCDSLSLYYQLYGEACRRWQKVFPIKTVEQFLEWYNPRWEENYYEMGFTPEEFGQVQVWADQWLDYSRAPLFAGVAQNLREWSKQAPMAIVSTTSSLLIRKRLGAEPGLEECFQYFKGGEDGCSEKREKVAHTLQTLGATAGVMVGDTPLDGDAGQHNGLQTVGVTYGWVSPQRVRAARPTRLVERPEELYQAVLDCLQ